MRQRSSARVAIFSSLLGLLTGCAAMESAAPERLAALRAKAQGCSQALPAIARYDVDRFGTLRASAEGPDADVIERNFFDCVSARGRWITWTPGQPAPMLEPLGADTPDPELGHRVP